MPSSAFPNSPKSVCLSSQQQWPIHKLSVTGSYGKYHCCLIRPARCQEADEFDEEACLDGQPVDHKCAFVNKQFRVIGLMIGHSPDW